MARLCHFYRIQKEPILYVVLNARRKDQRRKKRCKNLVGQSQSASHAFSPSLIFLLEQTVCSKLSTDLRRREPRTICLCVESKFHSSLSLSLSRFPIDPSTIIAPIFFFFPPFLLSSFFFFSFLFFFSYTCILSGERDKSRPPQIPTKLLTISVDQLFQNT